MIPEEKMTPSQVQSDRGCGDAVPEQHAALNYVADMTYCGADAKWHFKPGYNPQVVLVALAKALGAPTAEGTEEGR